MASGVPARLGDAMRSYAKMMRLLAGSGVAAAVGIGALATMPAGNAAVLSASGAGPARSARATAIGGDWEGRYTCSYGLTGLDLKIKGPGRGGALSATFSFYPAVKNPAVPVGIYTMRGTYSSASKIVLNAGR